MKKFILSLSVIFMLGLMAVAAGAHFYKIDSIPYGYHVDELSDAVTVECLGTEGVDAHDNHYPLFGQLNYGTPKPATYMYPAVGWGKVFGFSIPSLRCFSVVGHLMGIVGLFFLGRVLFGNMFGLWVAFAASISPWVWAPSRVAFESLFAPTFFIWGLYFFFRRTSPLYWALAGLFFACSMYSYPPMRLQVPLMVVTLGLYSLKKKKGSLASWASLGICLVLPLAPLVVKTLNGEVQQRFNYISITAPGFLKAIGKTNSWKDILEIFISNYKLHLTPNFLLFKGDPSLIHSLGHFGILSWLDMTAILLIPISLLFLLIKPLRSENPWNKNRWFLLWVIFNIFLGIIPSALTNSELPNSLRIVGSWPFTCLLTGYGMWFLQRLWAPLGLAATLAGGVFVVSLMRVYFDVYPDESKGMFSFWTLEQANAAKTEEDWQKFMLMYHDQDYHFRYFLMHYRHDTCTSTRLKWERQRDLLERLHLLR